MQLVRHNAKSRTRRTAQLDALVEQLERENDALRRQVAEFAQYRELAYCDPLTGLRNRRYLDERLSEELARTRRNASQAGVVLLIDLDRFKTINDLHGHKAGDQALQFVAELLRAVFRETDVCARTGGDEFVVLMPQTNRHGGKRAIARLRAKLAEANQTRTIPVQLSIGAASYWYDASEPQALMAIADRAMYRDKARHARALRTVEAKKSAA